MSRIGNKHIILPEGTTVNIDGEIVKVNGKLGTLEVKIPSCISVHIEDKDIYLTRINDSIEVKELHGTTRALLNNAIVGVTEGFSKNLEICGIGYRSALVGNAVKLKVGYSHEVVHEIPSGLKIELSGENNTKIKISGIKKDEVGEFAALLRDTRRPEPYGGKGIKYSYEHIARKEGKRAAAGGAKK